MEQKRSKFGNWMRNSITARMLVVGFLLLVLLIPLQFVQMLISERSMRQQEVITEINSKWGNEVLISGPILKIPYKTLKEERSYDSNSKVTQTTTKTVIHYAYLLPDSLAIDADVESLKRNRSIYESVVYTGDMAFTGNFPAIDFSEMDIDKEDILWDKISLEIRTSNLKGIRNSLMVKLGEEDLSMTPKYNLSYLNIIESTPLKVNYAEIASPIHFNFRIKINGSESLKFIPLGKETQVSMDSNWHSPGFDGSPLPDEETKSISSEGFHADWHAFQINRQFQQKFLNSLPDMESFGFGTNFVIPVDEYQKSERTSKYGFMVIGLTLLVFLLIQLVSRIYIHPFQYVMIGLALVMFYTLLISFSEHSSFLKAYLIAGGSVLALVTLYSRAILRGFKFPLLVCASLASLYGFIYVIIQLENYALLVGSIGLFVILGIVMFASRKIDWGND
jgi:inner membrane protein